MEKDKSRGLKHIKDKRKYKGNSTKNPKYVPSKAKPNLGSNWDRYASTEDDQEPKLSSSTDFALLSNVPISSGSHFQFAGDAMNENKDDQGANDLFFLNLDLLHKSILTIPFYQRLGISEAYFQEDEINCMDETAAKHLQSFKAHISNTVQRETVFNASSTCNVNSEEINRAEKNKLASDNFVKEDILELIENATIDDVPKDSDESLDMKRDEDLEQWLDDILDD